MVLSTAAQFKAAETLLDTASPAVLPAAEMDRYCGA
jgi:hypothetical protein